MQVYQFPECDSDEDEDFKQQDKELKASIPFAVVGSNTVIEIAGKKVRGRQYPWGVVDGEFIFENYKYFLCQFFSNYYLLKLNRFHTFSIINLINLKIFNCFYTVENPIHSDFVKLRTMLISTHMQDLKDTTNDVHYENFRTQCISQISQHAFRERGKLKRDSMSSNVDASISDTDRLLLQKDEEVRFRNIFF